MRRRGDHHQNESDVHQRRKRKSVASDSGALGPSNGLRVISIVAAAYWEVGEEEEQHRRRQLMVLPADEPVADVEAEVRPQPCHTGTAPTVVYF